MQFVLILTTLALLNVASCFDVNVYFFEKINEDFLKFNQEAATIAWQFSIDPGNPDLPHKGAVYLRNRLIWQEDVCSKWLEKGHLMNITQTRQMYLLCRGPRFTYEEARKMSNIYEQLISTYTESEICIHSAKPTKSPADQEAAILEFLRTVKTLLPTCEYSVAIAAKVAASGTGQRLPHLCLNGEDDFELMMRRTSNQYVQKWLWLVWREKVGPSMKKSYRQLVQIENLAARRSGFTDIGASWRDQLEIPNLRIICRQLYEEVRPLYAMLHGVVRFYLRRRYWDVVPTRGLIPAHLLGNLWSQDWESLLPLIHPIVIDLDQSLKTHNWTTLHMVKRAEDFYQSLGLPAMTETFWNQSVLERKDHRMRCHGTAADMFRQGDYRLLYCAKNSSDDLYVIHHELGHIHYYMAYEHQPGIFRAGHPALHESIGDSIMYGVLTPPHLHRLGLINDSMLFTKKLNREVSKGNNSHIYGETDDEEIGDLYNELSPDMILLLKTALSKLPQIPFALLIDEYRWKYFEGQLNETNTNTEFWKLAKELQGIQPPGPRGEEYFDAAAKFHVADNTPYIRYFLSYFLQHQLFETLCKAAVFGRSGITRPLPPSIAIHRCDIYGSKAAGKVLKDLMSRGQSQHWREILSETTGNDVINATALLRYYRPLQTILERVIRKHRIPIGW